MKPKNHRGIFRSRNVASDDIRSPMLRLLQDCNNAQSGMIEVDSNQGYADRACGRGQAHHRKGESIYHKGNIIK